MSVKVYEWLNKKAIFLPISLDRSYIPILDGLRGVAILLVIISHILIKTPLNDFSPGRAGVEIFFVLSGFLITTLLLKEKLKTGTISLRKFYIRRALRILPVAYLFLLVLILLNHFFALNLSYSSFIASALYVSNMPFHYERNWFNGHFWTLAVEEQFYLIFPALIVHYPRTYITFIFVIILSVPLLQYLGFHNVGIFYSNYLIHKLTYLFIYLFQEGSTSILIGSLLSIAMFKNILPSDLKRINRHISYCLLLIGIWLRTIYVEIAHSAYLSSVLFSIIVASVIYLTLTKPNDHLNSVLGNNLLVKLGVLSYSLYIWQQIFLYKQPWQSSFKYADSLILNMATLFVVAYCSYNLFELRFLKLKYRYKSA